MSAAEAFTELDMKLASVAEATQSTPTPATPLGTANGEEVPATVNDLEVQPLPISQQPLGETQLASSSSSSSKRGRKRKGQVGENEEWWPEEQNPAWLPQRWRVMIRHRSNGTNKDKYFIEPEKHHQFRSKREVLEYVDSGHRRPNKKLKTGGTSKAAPAMTIQPKRERGPPPPTVTWVSGNRGNSYYMPFIGDEMVPEATRLEWAAMFKDEPL